MQNSRHDPTDHIFKNIEKDVHALLNWKNLFVGIKIESIVKII